MLARAATAGFRARPSSAFTLRAIRISQQRSYADDRRPKPARTNPTKNPSAPQPSTKAVPFRSPASRGSSNAGATASATVREPRDGTTESIEYSKGQEEFRTANHPRANTTPQSKGESPDVPGSSTPRSVTTPLYASTPAETTGGASSTVEDTQGASSIAEDTQGASFIAEDTRGASSTASSSGPQSPSTQIPRNMPLPDLTRGIPSSFDFKDSTSAGDTGSRGSGEDEGAARSMSVSIGAGAGKGGGDLPKSAYISSIDRRRNQIANYAFATLLLLAATGSLFMGRNWESKEEEKKHPEAPSGWGFRLFYNRVKARLADTLGYYTEPAFPKLLPDVDPAFERPFTLVLSLDDLLIHSEWSREHGWRIAKRPGVDYFLRYLQQYYELVIFTSAPVISAEQIVRKLDPYRIVMWPLFREATKYVDGKHVKDLSYLNRDLSKVILIDTDPSHAKLQPENAIILPKWKGDPNDGELVGLIPFLEYMATMGLADARTVLRSFDGKHIPTEFAAREAVARKKFEEDLAKERAQRPHRIGKGLLTAVMGGRGGVGPDGLEQTAAEAIEQGKMLQDHIRERGQKQYEALEKEIRENGEKWLKEMAAEDEKFREEQMKGMRSSLAGFIGGAGPKQSDHTKQ